MDINEETTIKLDKKMQDAIDYHNHCVKLNRFSHLMKKMLIRMMKDGICLPNYIYPDDDSVAVFGVCDELGIALPPAFQ